MECAAAGRSWFDADAAAVALDDLVADGETDPGARVGVCGVDALGHLEAAVLVVGRDADPVSATGNRQAPGSGSAAISMRGASPG